MLNVFKAGWVTVMSSVVAVTSGCSGISRQETDQHWNEYLQMAPAGSFSSPDEEPRLQPFIKMYAQLDEASIKRHGPQVYAEDLFFNDTFHTFDSSEQVFSYFIRLSSKATTQVTALDYSASENDIWLRWKMRTRYSLWWKEIDAISVGVTHLRFDQQNRIVLQQDYWDGISGFYGDFPILGGMLGFVRNRIGEE